jgi:catechol 2,3-dioxygenase-like lactoylglutathione lyase family enzyme
MDLGTFSVSLAVENLDVSLAFYEKMGFVVIDGGHTSKDFPDTEDQKWRVVQNGETQLGLFQGMLPKNMLTFNPPDVHEVQRELKQNGVTLTVETADFGQGPAHIMLEDPDGNPILMDQR